MRHNSCLSVETLEDRTVPTATFQGAAWEPVAGDWNGDGRATIGSFDPQSATWYLRNADSVGSPDAGKFQFGATGWIPVVGDWNGDGKDGIGVVDPATGTWYLRNSLTSGAPDMKFQYGAANWIPVAGDWDGDGKTSIGVVDPRSSTWYLRNETGSGAADAANPFSFGLTGWRPVVGDWNGDGKETVGTVDPSNNWHLRNSDSSGSADAGEFNYGGAGWSVLTGKFTSDQGVAGVGAVRPEDGVWYLRSEPSKGAPDLANPFQYGVGGTTGYEDHNGDGFGDRDTNHDGVIEIGEDDHGS